MCPRLHYKLLVKMDRPSARVLNIKLHARSCITDDTDFCFNCDLLTIIMLMSTILTGCKSNKTTDRSNYNHS